jgi:hypothetical protein
MQEQGHGKLFERGIIHQSGFFPKMSGVELASNEVFDIPGKFTEDGINVSIKSAKYPKSENSAPTIHLSDAVRLYEATYDQSLRLISGFYNVESNRVIFQQIFECVIEGGLHLDLWGEVTHSGIKEFAAFIKREKALVDDEDDEGIRVLQRVASSYKEQFSSSGIISVNAKVARGVGRVQCSVDAMRLKTLIDSYDGYCKIFNQVDPYGDFPLPIAFEAGKRLQR